MNTPKWTSLNEVHTFIPIEMYMCLTVQHHPCFIWIPVLPVNLSYTLLILLLLFSTNLTYRDPIQWLQKQLSWCQPWLLQTCEWGDCTHGLPSAVRSGDPAGHASGLSRNLTTAAWNYNRLAIVMQSDAEIEFSHSNTAIVGSNRVLGAGKYSLLFVVCQSKYRELER
jgi:hypothetical protein